MFSSLTNKSYHNGILTCNMNVLIHDIVLVVYNYRGYRTLDTFVGSLKENTYVLIIYDILLRSI